MNLHEIELREGFRLVAPLEPVPSGIYIPDSEKEAPHSPLSIVQEVHGGPSTGRYHVITRGRMLPIPLGAAKNLRLVESDAILMTLPVDFDPSQEGLLVPYNQG